jgi:transglutaminase-like putative cysteine protease
MNRTQPRLWDFPSAAALFLILLTVGQRLYVTKWTSGLETAIVLALIGVLLGLALGFSKFGRMGVYWLTFGYGILMTILVLGGGLYRGLPWLERLSDLSDRIAYAFYLFFTKQPVHDTVLFVVFMALVFWIVGLLAGYALTRFGSFIGAVVPAGVVMLIVQLYDPGRGSNNTFLVIYFFLSLLLLGRLTFVQKRVFWKEKRLSLLNEAKLDLNITLVLTAFTAVFLAWITPTSVKSFTDVKTAWENFTQPLRDWQEDLGNAVAGLEGGAKASPIYFFGDALALGNQAAQGETTYLRVQAPPTDGKGRYYWRVRSYNYFLDDQWYAENVSSMAFVPDKVLVSLADPVGQAGEFTFTAVAADLAVLVTPARPVWVSHPAKLFFVQAPQEEMDPIQFLAESPVLLGEPYDVRAKVYDPTIAQLRSAEETYPDWVTAHYLQLPDDLSPEIAALAKQVTAQAETAYDRAEAITAYLRDNITYASTVESPPEGRDPLEWFLLDARSGFCNYYATAEVILLRTLGIPARMAVGFTQGELDEADTYVVRQRDAHAWPEVYFPGLGWVEFEPTGSQAPLVRLPDETALSSEEQDDEAESRREMSRRDELYQDIPDLAGEDQAEPWWGRPANFFLRLAFLYILTAVLLWMYSIGTFDPLLKTDRRDWRKPLPVLLKRFFEKRSMTPPGWLLGWAHQAELNPIARSFTIVYQSLHWLGRNPSPALTPAEAAAELSGLLPEVSAEIYSLSDDYQHHLYSQRFGYMYHTRRVVRIIRKEALRAVFRQRWATFLRLLRSGPGKKNLR